MSQAAPAPQLTAETFLAWERTQATRHHFFRGDVFAMAGGSPRHSRLASRLIARLDTALSGRPCDVHTADLRLGLDAEHFVYADAVVVCRPLVLRPGTTDVVTNPSLVCEVLSRSTEAYDRGAKQAAYLALPSLVHFLLVSQREPRVEVYSREGDGFRFRVHGPRELVRLDHFALALALDDLYEGVLELPGDEA
ncbi:MAG: Uma2 family endonuclease [Myxococcales bacterium]|nr:Uma2 family endonuclease [Myxococcales bacterium]